MQINLTVDKDNVILVFGKGCLHAVSSIDGMVLWKKDFSAERFKNLTSMYLTLFFLFKHHHFINVSLVNFSAA